MPAMSSLPMLSESIRRIAEMLGKSAFDHEGVTFSVENGGVFAELGSERVDLGKYSFPSMLPEVFREPMQSLLNAYPAPKMTGPPPIVGPDGTFIYPAH